MTSLALPALVTLAGLSLYQGTALAVGRARFKHLVKPPAMDGPEPFQRAVRVQQNTLEQLVFFLPSYWLACLWSEAALANLLGILWVAGRVAYAVGYLQAPERRGPGFGISFLSAAGLWVLALIGAIRELG
ncbi:MAPEG family protein [Cyanobium sp. LEGE 06143]|jgi:glutathione S-transferase|uniref:MAPEG family protein n=1 Tax=unclassified Cyanobium TaxID=2627006 RepID=UPI00164418D6|nr:MULTISPECIES: MAPEG family protein [unclassified Cyanobium]MBE9154718.1 MAPEG family protein [Cyanobium sp. LEGE 06113]MBE9172619.1 MAPEG family protein [Cyanobium sp. LEGE 06143]QNI70098.1 membrane-associated/ eicosanoid/glutathione metabolism (MAPEG) protein [Cyanobium sp. NS01]